MHHQVQQLSAEVTCEHCGREFKAITFWHLRNIHDYKSEHPIQDYKKKFGLKHAMSDESREKISGAKEDFWSKRGQHWTRDKILREIRRLHAKGESLRLNKVSSRMYQAGRRIFGTWEAAVEYAGLDYGEATGLNSWNEDKVVAEIQKLAASGSPLNATFIQKNHAALFSAAIKRFGRSWQRALRAAGLDPSFHNASRGIWTRDKAEEWVRKRFDEGQSILARDVPADLLQFVQRRLQTRWVDFVELLGIPYPGIKKRCNWTRDALLAEIRKWRRAGHRLNYRSVKNEYQALIHQARKYFGSWKLALNAAGI